MSHGRKKDQQDASHNRPPPYPSCGSRLRPWLHPPQKVPKVQDGLLGLYLIPFPSTRKHKCRVGRVQPLHHPPIHVAPLFTGVPEGLFSEVQWPPCLRRCLKRARAPTGSCCSPRTSSAPARGPRAAFLARTQGTPA